MADHQSARGSLALRRTRHNVKRRRADHPSLRAIELKGNLNNAFCRPDSEPARRDHLNLLDHADLIHDTGISNDCDQLALPFVLRSKCSLRRYHAKLKDRHAPANKSDKAMLHGVVSLLCQFVPSRIIEQAEMRKPAAPLRLGGHARSGRCRGWRPICPSQHGCRPIKPLDLSPALTCGLRNEETKAKPA